MKHTLGFNKKIAKRLHNSFSALCVLSLLLFILLAYYESAFADTSPDLSIDILMGGNGRYSLQQRIKKIEFKNSRTYSWEDFSAWGKEIFFEGFVQNPPTGSGPSKPVSKLFKCARCHNYEREDPVLTVQDPEARFQWIEETGDELFLIQGATMWGVVNRAEIG